VSINKPCALQERKFAIELNQKMTMKKLMVLSIVFASSALLQVAKGQALTGYIRYDDKTNQHRNLPPEREGLKATIPEYRTSTFRLYFNATASLYKAFQEDQPVQQQGFGGPGGGGGGGGFPGGGGPGGGGPGGGGPGGGGGGGGFPGGGRPPDGGGNRGFGGGGFGRTTNNQVFLNQDAGIVTYKKDLAGKTYIIADTVKIAPWKFGPDIKTILGYTCKVAFYTDNSNPEKPMEYTAWYTEKIRPFVGPDIYNTLPGGVLAIDINAGEHYWVATKVELRDLKPTGEEVVVPEDKKATVITMKEYKALEAENAKRMAERGIRIN